jgi:hypothetical protein
MPEDAVPVVGSGSARADVGGVVIVTVVVGPTVVGVVVVVVVVVDALVVVVGVVVVVVVLVVLVVVVSTTVVVVDGAASIAVRADPALFSLFGSVAGEETLASLVIVEPPGTAASMLRTTVNVAVAPLANEVRVMVMVPLDPTSGESIDATGPEFCAAETKVVPAGSTSTTVAGVAFEGPSLLTTSSYVISPPAVAVSGAVLVRETSACWMTSSVSVAESLPGFGSLVPAPALTVAVLDSEPDAAAEIAADAV